MPRNRQDIIRRSRSRRGIKTGLEKELQARIVELAGMCGWMVYHTWDSRRSHVGFPDLILIRGDTLLAIELKKNEAAISAMRTSERGRKQLEWIRAFQQVRKVGASVIGPDDEQKLNELLVQPFKQKGERGKLRAAIGKVHGE